MRRSIVGNPQGNILLTISFTLVFAFVVSGVVSSISSVIGNTNDLNLERFRLKLESELRSRVLNEISWANTLAAPENVNQLKCIQEISPDETRDDRPSYCTDSDGKSILDPAVAPETGGDSIVLYESFNDGVGNPVPYYSSKKADTTHGFSMTGERCNEFIAPPASGNNDCPMKLFLDLVVHCEINNGDPCGNSSLNIVGHILYNPEKKSKLSHLNFGNRKIIIQRPPLARLSRQNCDAIGGSDLDATDGSYDCSLPLAAIRCPDGYALIGIVGGEPRCTKFREPRSGGGGGPPPGSKGASN